MKESNEQTLKAFAEVENMTDEERAKYPSAEALFKSLDTESKKLNIKEVKFTLMSLDEIYDMHVRGKARKGIILCYDDENLLRTYTNISTDVEISYTLDMSSFVYKLNLLNSQNNGD